MLSGCVRWHQSLAWSNLMKHIEEWLNDYFGQPVKRDALKIKSNLQETKDHQLITKKGCRIYIPRRYEESGLAFLDDRILITCIYMMVFENAYSIVNCPTKMEITPDSINIVDIDGESYFEFMFFAGGIITPNTNLVMEDTFVYYIYDRFIAKGKIPLFLNYTDLGRILEASARFAGANIAPNNVVMEMVVASISRDIKDRTKYYRHSIKSMQDQDTNPPAFIALRNIMYGTTNTTSRLVGSYDAIAFTSALVSPATKREGVEDLLLK